MSTATVLVTGGSGFIATQTIVQLLNAGYHVRATVRSLKRQDEVTTMLKEGGIVDFTNLKFFEADLNSDNGWAEAVQGCTYVLHMASPFPLSSPKNEDDLIIPAKQGTVRVLKFARDAKVKRVVVTSSAASVVYGHGNQPNLTFDETYWTKLDGPGVGAYTKSKALAEKAAWDFIESEGQGLELATVLPALVCGPLLGPSAKSSVSVIQQMLDGSMPMVPDVSFGIVDVRDVADLHIRAMTNEKANGERFLCNCPPSLSLLEISLLLREELGTKAKKAPTRQIPHLVLKAAGFFNKDFASFAADRGNRAQQSNQKAKNLLGWEPRPAREAIPATAESLFKFGLVKV